MFTFRWEAIPVTVHHEFVTVRLWIVGPDAVPINCGLVVMRQEEWVALALRPPISDLIRCEAAVTEGSVETLLERLVGQAA